MNDIDELRTRIHEIRGVQVMLDKDLAELYGVEVKNLNKAVKRNIDRFPPDFMFQLTKEELNTLRFQNGTLKAGRGEHTKYLPYVFTEFGVTMLSSVLRSEIAIQVNIRIMRAFVAVRKNFAMQGSEHDELEDRIKRLEDTFEESLRDHNDIDEDTRFRLDRIEEALAEMRGDIQYLTRNGNPGRTQIKGFK